MSDQMTVEDLSRLLDPMFAGMLTVDELATLHFQIIRSADGAYGPALKPDVLLERAELLVRWRVRGEDGWSGGLHQEESVAIMTRFVQSDLQDFIAESRFGWGQLRGPRDLP